MDGSKLKEMEAKVERLRAELYRKIGDNEEKLSDSSILPLSNELDALIVDYMRARNKHQRACSKRH